jgi:hypothetical protein
MLILSLGSKLLSAVRAVTAFCPLAELIVSVLIVRNSWISLLIGQYMLDELDHQRGEGAFQGEEVRIRICMKHQSNHHASHSKSR